MKTWQRSEEQAAYLLKASLTPASGSRPGKRGDNYDGESRGEHKYTQRPFIRIQKRWLDKIEAEALLRGEMPRLSFEVEGYGMWCLVPGWYWSRELPREWNRICGKSFVLWGDDLCRAKTPFAIMVGGEPWVCCRLAQAGPHLTREGRNG